MELIIGLFLMFGGIGLAVSNDADKKGFTPISKQTRIVEQSREVIYSEQVLQEWK